MTRYEVVLMVKGLAQTVPIKAEDRITAVDDAARLFAGRQNTDTLKVTVISVKEITSVK